jgi:hypothetical protein
MGRKTTTFFVKQGSAYNMALESGPKDIKANLAEIVKLVWGDLFYLTVPEDRIAQLKNNNLLMTVRLEAGLTPVGYTPIKEENINSDGDESMAAAVAKGVTKGMGVPILNYIMAMGAGGCVIFIACLAMGWINIGK